MTSRSRRTAAVVLGGLAAVLVACGGEPEPTPPDHLSANSVEDLHRGCEDIGDGYPDAAKYAGDGPHTTAVFAKSRITDLETTAQHQPEYEPANSSVPDSILAEPGSPAEVALLACGEGEPGDEQLNVCEYDSVIGSGGPDIPLYSQHYTFTVYELRTGRVVDTLELDTKMGQPLSSCPTTVESGASKIFAKAQPYELNELLEDLVESPAK